MHLSTIVIVVRVSIVGMDERSGEVIQADRAWFLSVTNNIAHSDSTWVLVMARALVQ